MVDALLQKPLLDSSHGWDDEVASQVALSLSANHDFNLCLTYASGIIKLQDPSTGRVLDRINANDIIGVQIELCLDEKDKDTCTTTRSAKKGIHGQEKMEALEKDIGEKMIGFSSDSSREGAGAGECPFGGEGATAYLNIYAYPRALPRRGIFQQLKECCTNGGNEFIDDDEHKSDVDALGYRFEKHRRYKLQPTEDFAKASSLVKNIRHVAGLHSTSHRYLVVVNPFSGRKKGREIYEKVVKKMLDESGLSHDVLITRRAGHAVERMMEKNGDAPVVADAISSEERDIAEYDGIIAIGGDGILAEMLQGLKKRTDYDNIVQKLTFGIVGCGTSNGLAASILHAAKEKYSQLESTFMICKGRSSELDLSYYETENKTYTSFLTYSWAMIADIDIESEIIRFMGVLRNDIWAVWRVINLRSYRGKFSYLPADQVKPGDSVRNNFPAFDEEVPSTWVTMEEDFILFWASQVSHASTTTLQSPDSNLNDGIFNILVIRKPCSRLGVVKVLLGLENGSHVKNAKAEFFPCVAFRLDPISKGSFHDIDGEVVESGRIQGHVESSGINFFT